MIAAIISSQMISQVAASRLQLSAPASYTVIPGANVTLDNPQIAITGALSGEDVFCAFDLSTPFQGRLLLPDGSLVVYNSKRFWPPIAKQEPLNAILQKLVFEAKSMNISTTVNAYCESNTYPMQGINASATIILTDVIQTTEIKSGTTQSATLMLAPFSTAMSVSTTLPLASGSQLSLSTASSALQTQTTVANLFSSMSTIASGKSQNMISGMLITTSLPAPDSLIEAQLNSSQSPSVDGLDRYGWILIAIGSVLCLCSCFALVMYGTRRRLNKNKQNKPEQEIPIPENKVPSHSSDVTMTSVIVAGCNPSAEADHVNVPQLYHQFSDRVKETAKANYGNPEDLERINNSIFNGVHRATRTVDLHHGYTEQLPGIGAPRARYLNGPKAEKNHYDDPLAHIRELELDSPSAQYIDVNELQVPV